jgi:site-specific DNA recombinase
MSKEEIAATVNAITGLMRVLEQSDPADKAEIYAQLGLRLTYHPGEKKVIVRAEPGRTCTEGSCPRGESPVIYMPVIMGELALGGCQ